MLLLRIKCKSSLTSEEKIGCVSDFYLAYTRRSNHDEDVSTFDIARDELDNSKKQEFNVPCKVEGAHVL